MLKIPFECRAFLKLRIPQKNNIMGLSITTYELEDFNYQFHRGIDRNGEINTGLKGGIVNMSVIGTPSDELLAWMFDHMKKYDGELTIMDASKETLEQAYFEEGRLTELELKYRAESKNHTVTLLTLVVENLRIDNACFDNLNI